MTDGNQNPTPPAAGEVLLCLAGGIACYKAAYLASALVQRGCGVSVAMTDAATRFVTPLTFQALTGRKVHTTLWPDAEDFSSRHIALTEQAGVIVVAPATADILAKMACGIADDLVSTLLLAAGEVPILVAPAMNTRMWTAPPTQANIKTLATRGVHLIGPDSGRLACGTTGPGRMSDPDDILRKTLDLLSQKPTD